jgi:hypothetical protein
MATKERASAFDSLNLSRFTPDSEPEPDTLSPEGIRAIAKASHFTSREPERSTEPAPTKHKPRRYRTGRSQQFNCRTTQACYDGMYAIADQQEWKIGETLERAYAALKRELEGQGRG